MPCGQPTREQGGGWRKDMGVDGVGLTQAFLLLRQRRPVVKRRVRSVELGSGMLARRKP
jgi:hypothetical protein